MTHRRSPFTLTLLILIPCVFIYQIAIVLIGQRTDLAGPPVMLTWKNDMLQYQCLGNEIRNRIPEHDSLYVGNGSASLLAVELAIVATPDHPIVAQPGEAKWKLHLVPSSNGCYGQSLLVERVGSP